MRVRVPCMVWMRSEVEGTLVGTMRLRGTPGAVRQPAAGLTRKHIQRHQQGLRHSVGRGTDWDRHHQMYKERVDRCNFHVLLSSSCLPLLLSVYFYIFAIVFIARPSFLLSLPKSSSSSTHSTCSQPFSPSFNCLYILLILACMAL